MFWALQRCSNNSCSALAELEGANERATITVLASRLESYVQSISIICFVTMAAICAVRLLLCYCLSNCMK